MKVIRNPVNNELVPTEFYLGQNYPNPFREKTIIKYCLPYKTRVSITIFNSNGEMIEKLIDDEKKAGTYKIEFYASNISEGVYSYLLCAGEYRVIKKMILQKSFCKK